MKLKNKINVTMMSVLALGMASCVDTISFGNAFLEKAPGADVTEDTVFNNAEYTKQFLNKIYTMQYYGLPYSNSTTKPYPCDPYVGKNQLLTDCWQNSFDGNSIKSQYYNGGLNSRYSTRGCTFEFSRSNVWEAVRASWKLMEHLSTVPNLTDAEKKQMRAEANCLIASRYFDTFRFYGGLPIVKSSYKFDDDASTYKIPRGTVEQTVNFMDSLLTAAIPDLPWQYEGSENLGRWTQAGAMALRCKIWQFAASPLFNSDLPYAGGSSDAEKGKYVWWGNYDKARWQKFYDCCKAFFDALNAHPGSYYLEQAEKKENGKTLTNNDYRSAYRRAYFERESHEILHSVRVNAYDNFSSKGYTWHQSGADSGKGMSGRTAFNPTLEYVEKFPWADGTPVKEFDKMSAEEKAKMFTTGLDASENGVKGSKASYTRDPRLYENVLVNGAYQSLDWTSNHGNLGVSGQPMRFEIWVGGKNAGQTPVTQTLDFATGFANNKYYLSPRGNDALRKYTQWTYIRLAEMYLDYAEAILKTTGEVSEALKWINPIRNRVGLKNLEEVNQNAVASADALMDELLDERVRELGMEDTRWFDIVRYKKGGDLLTKPLHGLRIYRQKDGKDYDKVWFGSGETYPTSFRYEKFELSTKRIWWSQGFDAKWYLQPFPEAEVLRGYGLVQNHGW